MIDFFIDYEKAKQCKNEDCYCICLKCGRCGRKFDDEGIMVDDGGTEVEDDE